jgi:hypothetical protein
MFIKIRRIRWEGQVIYMHTTFESKNLKKAKYHLIDLEVHGKIILSRVRVAHKTGF